MPPKWYNIACTTNQYYQRRPYVNTASKITELPALTADLLQSNSCLVDNLFADLWKQMGMKALLNKAGFIQTLPAMESEREGW
jgi:hypothetical protein